MKLILAIFFVFFIFPNSYAAKIDLTGYWDFFGQNKPINFDEAKNVSSDKFRSIMTPGNWPSENNAKAYRYGVYKKTINLDPKDLNEKLVLNLNTYVSGVEVYINNKLEYERHDKNPVVNYYPFATIPVLFESSTPKLEIYIIVDTILMRGVYQEIFDIRRVDELSYKYKLLLFFGSDFRVFSSYITFLFGFFFIVIYFKTKKNIYLHSSLAVASGYFYFGMSNTLFYHFFKIDDILLFHYIGVLLQSVFFNFFAQNFYRKYKLANKIIWGISSVFISLIGFLIFNFNHDLFLITRKLLFVFSYLVALPVPFILFNARKMSKTIYLIWGSSLYLIASLHDMLMALGYFSSFQLFSLGSFIFSLSVIHYIVIQFTESFKRQTVLLSKLSEVNSFMDEKIEAKTKQIKVDLDSKLEFAKLSGMSEISSRVLHEIGNEITPIYSNIKDMKSHFDISHKYFTGLIGKFTSAIDSSSEFDENISLGDKKKFRSILISMEKEQKNIVERFVSDNQQINFSLEKIEKIIKAQEEYAKGFIYNETVVLGNILNDAIEICSNKYDLENIEFEIQGNKSLNIDGSKIKLLHIFTGLFANAIEEYLEQDKEVKRIEIKIKEEQNDVIISIHDYAGGIKENKGIDVTNIFQKGTTTKKNKLGFGLHVISNMVSELGAKISIDNIPGTGLSVNLIFHKK